VFAADRGGLPEYFADYLRMGGNVPTPE